jgi:NitT/TauT family transport system substrate-binding protein
MVHAALSSLEVHGGPHTFNAIYATRKFVAANPKTIAAFAEALDEANDWIVKNPAEAAKLYIAAEKSKLAPDFVEAIIHDKDVPFTSLPERARAFADFKYKAGLIKKKADSWKDLFQASRPFLGLG